MDILLTSFLTAFAFIILLFKMGIGKFLRFSWQTDVIVSGILTFLFFGTFIGMLTGIIAGIIISLFLSIAKAISNTNKK